MSDAPGDGGSGKGPGAALLPAGGAHKARIEVRWSTVAATLEALAVPACALEPAAGVFPGGQKPGPGGPRLALSNTALDRLLHYEFGGPGALNGCPLAQIWPQRIEQRPGGELRVEGVEGHARRSDGSLVPVRLTIRPCRLGCESSHGQESRSICTLEDLRPQREAQGRLLAAERLMSQGAVVAGVAHEVNNPVCLLLANLKELQRALDEILPVPRPDDLALLPPAERDELHVVQEMHSMLFDAREGAQRILEVVRDLVQLSHPDAAPAEPMQMNSLLETVLRLARPALSGTHVQRSLGTVPLIRAQRPRLFQVLLNLLINAVHAVAEVEVSRRSILLRTRAEPVHGRPGVLLEIEDTGCGMSQAVLNRIYEPFFTTKEAGMGTGLGLALSRTILLQHGGTIEVRSAPGAGTRVAVWLPCEPPAELSHAPAPAAGIAGLPRRS